MRERAYVKLEMQLDKLPDWARGRKVTEEESQNAPGESKEQN